MASRSNSQDLVLKLYRIARLIRRTEERVIDEYHPADEMRCPIHLCIGQEATPAALSLLMRPSDTLMSHHRNHGYYLAKGAPLDAMIAEFYGKATGANGGLAGSQELCHHDSLFFSGTILSGAMALAAGAAFANQYEKRNDIAIGVIGDGGMEQGIVFEVLNFVAHAKLPYLVICENNRFSAQTHIDQRANARTLSQRAAAFGLTTAEVDGNDPLELYQVLGDVVDQVRTGKPAFVEANTYRICGHVGPESDDHLAYRSEEEIAKWRRRDPIELLRSLLSDPAAANAAATADAEIERELDRAFANAKSAAFPVYDQALACNAPNKYSPIATPLIEGLVSENFNPRQAETRLRPY